MKSVVFCNNRIFAEQQINLLIAKGYWQNILELKLEKKTRKTIKIGAFLKS